MRQFGFRCRLGVAVLGGLLYACGGYDGSTFLRSVEVYDPRAGKWSFVTPMAITRSRVALAANADKLWAVGGYDGVANLRFGFDQPSHVDICIKFELIRTVLWRCTIRGARRGTTRPAWSLTRAELDSESSPFPRRTFSQPKEHSRRLTLVSLMFQSNADNSPATVAFVCFWLPLSPKNPPVAFEVEVNGIHSLSRTCRPL